MIIDLVWLVFSAQSVYLYHIATYVGAKLNVRWQPGDDLSNVRTTGRTTASTDQQNSDDIVTYQCSPRGSRVLTIPTQTPPPPATSTMSHRCVDEPWTTADDGDSTCWRQQQVDRTTVKHHTCTLTSSCRWIETPHLYVASEQTSSSRPTTTLPSTLELTSHLYC